MFDNDIRSNIRAKIRPFPRVATYPTDWTGQRTFEQIYDDLMPSFNRLLRYYRNHELDIPDLIAHAFMLLWIDISADTSMPATADKGGALKLLLNRTNPQLYRKFYRLEMYLEDIATRSGDPDDVLIDGFDYPHIIGHATYAEAIELGIDIEKVTVETEKIYGQLAASGSIVRQHHRSRTGRRGSHRWPEWHEVVLVADDERGQADAR